MIKDYEEKTMEIIVKEPKMNDPYLLNLIDLCDRVQTCMSPTCYYSEETKKAKNESCEATLMLNSPFVGCLGKLQIHPPPTSKYSCLQGRDFNNPLIETGIEMFSIYKECTRKIMEDNCGDEAVENFDKYAEILLDGFKRMKAFAGSFYSK